MYHVLKMDKTKDTCWDPWGKSGLCGYRTPRCPAGPEITQCFPNRYKIAPV